MTEITRCPSCGKKPEPWHDRRSDTYRLGCCPGYTGAATEEEAIQKWNDKCREYIAKRREY